MKKIIVFFVVSFMFAGCYTENHRDNLKNACKQLQTEYNSLVSKRNRLIEQITSLTTSVDELQSKHNALSKGRQPRYIVKFEIKQGTFTLDPFEHIKNSMNAIEVEIPVDKDYYNRLSVGQDLTDAFKFGSLVMDGDFSSLHMRVKSKRIE